MGSRTTYNFKMIQNNHQKIDLENFIKRFSKTLNLPKRKPGKPILLVPAGPSHVGKTMVMKFIEKKLPYFVRICHDDMRLFLRKRKFLTHEIESFLSKDFPSYLLATDYLRMGYSVILDDNFASKQMKLMLAREVAGEFNTDFFIIKVLAPSQLVKKRLLKEKFSKKTLFPNWQTAWDHFKRSRKEFDYKKLNKLYFAKVDNSKPLEPQLREKILLLKKAMQS